ncbi:thioredoxin family protein [Desulfococcaceae bacterium HSG9]|nr:thioredoxin family protein [Desulfococcaceae bacterium HSG9]
MKLEILGCCPNCGSLFYDRLLQTLEKVGLRGKVQVEQVKDPNYFVELGVYMTPALVLDGEVISIGKLLMPDDILKLFQAKETE